MDYFCKGIVCIQSPEETGTGFILSQEGLIVTCAHVLGNPPQRKVTLFFYYDTQPYTALVDIDLWKAKGHHDVAFLRLQGKLPGCAHPLPLGSSNGTQNHRIASRGFPAIKGIVDLPAYGTMIHTSRKKIDQSPLLILSSQEITKGFSGAPVWDEVRQRVIGMVSTIIKPDEYNKRNDVVCAIPSDILQDLSQEGLVQDICPYLGLKPYTETDAPFFFGRERYLEKLQELFYQDARVLTMLGPVASGKTSILHAGLLYQIHQGTFHARSRYWEVVVFHPGKDPFQEFIEAGLADTTSDLAQSITVWIRQHPKIERLIICLDQFEELFSLPYETQDIFLKQIASLITEDVASIIIAMDDAYYSLLASHTDFIQLIEHTLSNIPPLSKTEILDVITQPAHVVDLHFESGLQEHIANDTLRTTRELEELKKKKKHSSVLPLLSYLLEQLFEMREDNSIHHDHLEALGGVSGALRIWAWETYRDLNEQQKSLMQRIFVNLVQFDGRSAADKIYQRTVKTVTQLCHSSTEEQDVFAIINLCAKRHLLELHRDEKNNEIYVKIMHDIILYDWGLLQEWLKADAQFLSWRQHLEALRKPWELSHGFLHKRDSAFLLRGSLLLEAEGWQRTYPEKLTVPEHAFIQASMDLFQKEEAKRIQQEATKQQRVLAQAKHIATRALLLQEQRPDLLRQSLLLAVEASHYARCAEADLALRQGLALLPQLTYRLRHATKKQSLIFSTDGQSLIAAGDDGIVMLENVNQSNETYSLLSKSRVHSFAISHDGKYLITLNADGRIWLIIRYLHSSALLLGQSGIVNCLTLSQQSPPLIVAGCKDGRVLLWKCSEKDDQNPISSFRVHHAHNQAITAIALSSCSNYLAVASEDGTIKVIDILSGKPINSFSQRNIVHKLLFSLDNTYLAFMHDTIASLWVWNTNIRTFFRNRNHLVKRLPHQGRVNDIAFSPDGEYLSTASEDGIVSLWHLQHTEQYAYLFHESPVLALCYASHGQSLVTSCRDHVVRIFDLSSHMLIHCIPHSWPVQAIATHPYKPYIATADANDHIYLWQIDQGSKVSTFFYEGTIVNFLFTRENRSEYLHVTLQKQDMLSIWLFKTGGQTEKVADASIIQSSSSFAISHNGQKLLRWNATHCQFSPDSQWFAIATKDGYLHILHTETRQLHFSYQIHCSIELIIFSPDHAYLAVICQKTMMIWRWQEKNQTEPSLFTCEEAITAFAFSQDNAYFIATGTSEKAYIWRWQQSRDYHAQLKHEGAIRVCIMSPDGTYVLTTGEDKKICLWETRSGLVHQYFPYQADIFAAAFSPDGRYLAVTGRDQKATIWETETGQQLAHLPLDHDGIALAFNANNRYLATASVDGKAIIWLWHPEDLIAKVKPRITSNLTHQEWQEFLGNEPYRKTFTDLNWREEPIKNPWEDT